jgi:VanZ family protein
MGSDHHTIRRWIPGISFTLFIYATLSLIPQLWETANKKFGPDTVRGFSGMLFAFLFCLGTAYTLLRSKERRWPRTLWFLSIAAVYYFLLSAIELTSERVHLLEYGVLAWLYSTPLVKTVGDKTVPYIAGVLAFTAGVGDEWIQYLLPNRVGSVTDTYLNAISAGLGLLLAFRVFRTKPLPGVTVRGIRWASITSIIALATFAAFLSVATDFGLRHRDPQIGSFYSHFTLEELRRIDSTETAKYAALVKDLYPVKMHTYLKDEARVDKFAGEFLVHLFRRDRYEEKKSFWVAWKENRILARHFPRVLAGSGYAWPEEKNRLIQAAMEKKETDFYESPVAKGDLIVSLTPPETVLLFATGCVFFLWNAWRPYRIAFFLNKELVPDAN